MLDPRPLLASALLLLAPAAASGETLPALVYRGRAQASSPDLVAVITRESCADTMADAAEGGGVQEYTARVSFPEGDARVGCCARPAAEAPAATATEPPAASPVAAAASGRPEPGGEIVAVELSGGTLCRSTGKGATLAFEGRRASYTCGTRDGDTVALLGELQPAEGGFRIVRARLRHADGGFTLRSSETILVTALR
jgi:hypothetical protein